jgi:hypothetical protein
MSYDFNVLANPLSILRHVHPAAAGRVVFKGGGGGGAPTTQNIQQSNLPEYVRPQFERLLGRAEDLSTGRYTPFTGQRVATQGMGDINQAYDITRGVAGSGIAGLPEAAGVLAGNVQAGQQIAGQAGQPFQFTPAGQFTADTAQQYMSPYIQSVVDVQSRAAREADLEQRAGMRAQAVQSGAFGGSRQAVQEGIADRELQNRLAGIQAQGLQTAFEQGSQQFGADRAARMAAEQAQAGANQQAQQAQLQALGFSAEQAQQMVGLGGQQRAADIQGAQLLETIGRSQRGLQQEGLDIAYQDFIRQQAFPEQQLQMLSGILRGVPVQPGVTQTAYAPFNPLQQLAGAGLAGIGLYRGLA